MTRTPANRADKGIADALRSEEDWIAVRHRFHGFTRHKERSGLALSGGGIRSATFSLGVLQALSRQGLIPHVDYLSTVSGGSYIGAFFGALYVDPKHRYVDEPEFNDKARREFAAMPLQSPRGRMAVARLREFGRYLTPGGFSDKVYGMSLMARNWITLHLVLGFVPLLFFLVLRLLDSQILNALGSEASRPFASWALVALVAVTATLSAGFASGFWFGRREQVSDNFVRDLATNAIFLAALAGVGVTGVFLYRNLRSALGAEALRHQAPLIAICATLAAAVLSYLYYATSERNKVTPGSNLTAQETEDRVRSRMTRALATSNFWLALLVAMMAIQFLGSSVAEAIDQSAMHYRYVQRYVGESDLYAALRVTWRFFWPLFIVLLPAVLTVWAHGALRRGSGPGWLARPSGQAALGSSILFLWLVIWAATATLVTKDALGWFSAAVALGLVVVSFCFGFLNLSSLVALYAPRLKRAYIGASNLSGDQGFDIERAGDFITMDTYYGRPSADAAGSPAVDKIPDLSLLRPVHLINVTIAQTEPEGASQVVAYDRKGKPMHVSPAGIVHQHGGVGLSCLRDRATAEVLGLSHWTAISGAAASTAIGSLTSIGLSILAMMANVRLGYWWKTDAKQDIGIKSPSDTVLGYLVSELQGRFATNEEKRRRWYLSDGGHFENTGVYALIQRRLDFIMVCDNGADPDYQLDDFVRLIDRVRTDLNVEIAFYESSELDALMGTDADLRSAFGGYRELACPPDPSGAGPNPYAALARIRYDIDQVAGSSGSQEEQANATLLLIKPRLNFTEPPELLAYQRRAAGRSFPQQTTLDQFFDEEQWEAYRRFGEIVGERVFARSSAAWSPRANLAGTKDRPDTILGALR